MKSLLFLALLGSAFPALADRLPMPANAPASFTTECSSCHIAYQPALLKAADWRKLMAGLSDHFGSDATVDQKTGQEIGAFLERHAGNASRLGNAGNPPRITQTSRFIRKHDEIPAKYWRDPRVKSAANCEACHPDAARGSYSEHDISIRELRE
ncbi:MAG: cytochrome C [Betaproteobacteria bacterium HGW-Betaproteobacteria-6]|jgi:phage-related protein|nr:MAG: cytochrome C [Betaproteobacteria bacterium HGW-Betaproteobacteria-6]PKO88775.1 MAG: cytochrome C [Betaproteobacteria bacterium HGW-Betaproteobacteria-10]